MADGQNLLIERIRAWQANGMVHPLTCGKDSSHAKLIPVATGDRVILRCLDCDYEQEKIPSYIMKAGSWLGSTRWPF